MVMLGWPKQFQLHSGDISAVRGQTGPQIVHYITFLSLLSRKQLKRIVVGVRLEQVFARAQWHMSGVHVTLYSAPGSSKAVLVTAAAASHCSEGEMSKLFSLVINIKVKKFINRKCIYEKMKSKDLYQSIWKVKNIYEKFNSKGPYSRLILPVPCWGVWSMVDLVVWCPWLHTTLTVLHSWGGSISC